MNDYPRAVDAYEILIELGRMAGSFVSEMMGISGLGLYAFERGELTFAYETGMQGVEHVIRSRLAQIKDDLRATSAEISKAAQLMQAAARARELGLLQGAPKALFFGIIIGPTVTEDRCQPPDGLFYLEGATI